MKHEWTKEQMPGMTDSSAPAEPPKEEARCQLCGAETFWVRDRFVCPACGHENGTARLAEVTAPASSGAPAEQPKVRKIGPRPGIANEDLDLVPPDGAAALRDVIEAAIEEIEWWKDEHSCCDGHEKDVIAKLRAALASLSGTAQDPPPRSIAMTAVTVSFNGCLRILSERFESTSQGPRRTRSWPSR